MTGGKKNARGKQRQSVKRSRLTFAVFVNETFDQISDEISRISSFTDVKRCLLRLLIWNVMNLAKCVHVEDVKELMEQLGLMAENDRCGIEVTD